MHACNKLVPPNINRYPRTPLIFFPFLFQCLLFSHACFAPLPTVPVSSGPISRATHRFTSAADSTLLRSDPFFGSPARLSTASRYPVYRSTGPKTRSKISSSWPYWRSCWIGCFWVCEVECLTYLPTYLPTYLERGGEGKMIHIKIGLGAGGRAVSSCSILLSCIEARNRAGIH
jgi:hypothetical protein